MKTNFLFKSIFFLTTTFLLFVGAYLLGSRMLISMTMGLFGCTLGGVIGIWIKKKKKIKSDPKLKKELLLFYGLAIVFSAIWFFSWDARVIRWIGVVLIFFISLIIVAIRNKILNKIIE